MLTLHQTLTVKHLPCAACLATQATCPGDTNGIQDLQMVIKLTGLYLYTQSHINCVGQDVLTIRADCYHQSDDSSDFKMA